MTTAPLRARGSRRRRVAAGLMVALACIAAGSALPARPAVADSKTQLVGEGEDWQLPLLEELQTRTAHKILPYTHGYLNVGDDQARQDLASGLADYASVGSPMTADEVAAAKKNHRKIAYVPYAYGAVAVAFSIDTQANTVVPSMKLTDATLAKVFSHDLTIWTDPEILAENTPDPGDLANPKPPPNILTVTRLDSSWTTASLIQYFLSDPSARATWNAYASHLSSPPDTLLDRWPADTFNGTLGIISGSKGVLDTMLQLDPATGQKYPSATTHHIAYLAPAWAARFGAPLVSIQNKAGQFVAPTNAGVLKALEQGGTVDPKTNLISLDFSKMTDPTAYPIPMVEYFAVPVTGLSADKAKALAAFIKYTLSDAGQKDVADTGYVPVSPALRTSGLKIADELAATTQQSVTTTTTKSGVTTTTNHATATTTDTTPTSGAAVDPTLSGSDGSGTGSGGSGLPFTGGPSMAIVAGAAVVLCAAVIGRRRVRRARV